MRVILLFILFFGVYKLEAQQWVQFSQSSNYGTFLNPAYAGYKSVLNATIAHRSQYVGLGTKAIGTQLASFSSPFQSSKFGLGFRIVNDFIGLQRYTNIDLNAAYHILEGKNRLSGGVNF
ncbi:type IX secretion system membrane protein PorP/SprF, partial [Chitinophagales bacterium]|nr:type IX secretion system membrane protein PorP/SprF [Chitinophagales bacterium]